jgi:hypothetical protein
MTVAQQKKLDTIIAKLEALQSDCAGKATQKEKDAIQVAKSRLLAILEM